MNSRKVISSLRNYHGIEEITVIDGHKVLYSGSIAAFLEDCEPGMKPFRDSILERQIVENTVLHSKLFVFI